MRCRRGIRAAASTPSRIRTIAAPTSATATAWCTARPSASCSTRRRCSSRARAISTARASPIAWKWRRSPAPSPASLGLDEDLTECLALAHDLGHPPFGHAGERGLNEALRDFGGFDHNDQSFRVVTLLEQRYAAFDGLNLSWETLEGLAKHNGPLKNPPPTIASFNGVMPLDLSRQTSAEAQVAAFSDDIAYNTHDLDDGLRAGLFEFEDILAPAGDRRSGAPRPVP